MKTLRADHLTLHLAHTRICTDLSWEIGPGQVCGVMGRNGVGKTTLLHALADLQTPQAGTVFLTDQPLKNLSRRTIAQSISVLFQEHPPRFPARVFDTVALGRYPHLGFLPTLSSTDHDRIEQALATVKLLDKQSHCITTLSGGEHQRLNIALCLVQDTPIYLLDEPVSHLDLPLQMHILRHFKHLAKQQAKCVVMVLHDVNWIARFCDHVIMLLGDGAYFAGPAADLLDKNRLTQLYQHPLTPYTTEQGPLWVAE